MWEPVEARHNFKMFRAISITVRVIYVVFRLFVTVAEMAFDEIDCLIYAAEQKWKSLSWSAFSVLARIVHTEREIENMMSKIKNWFRARGIEACERAAEKIICEYAWPVNIGAGDAEKSEKRWPFAQRVDSEIDFNTHRLPFVTGHHDVVICEQVIEHLHNTTHFILELNRIMEHGGHLILSTENLASVPNILALICQRAPFSTQPVCGRYVGGFNDRDCGYPEGMPWNDPAYSGIHGHVRVLTVSQVKALFERMGFKLISKRGFALNHYVLFHFVKL